MLESLLWGGVAAASLVIGAAFALLRSWKDAFIGAVLGFGAGALMASVSFELAEEGLRVGGAVAIGLAVGALVFYLSDKRAPGSTGSPPVPCSSCSSTR